MNTYRLLAVSGSFRKDSLNTKLLEAFADHAPEGVSIEIAEYDQVPLYNQDEDATFPDAVNALKEKIRAADGVLIATPEYNRSVPGVLKNMIDYTSRPYGDNAWDQKPVYVVGASIGGVGTAAAQGELKKVMLYLNARVLGQPEFYGSVVQEKLDADGRLADEKTLELVARGTAAFTAFIEQLR
jgi:chromate reductase